MYPNIFKHITAVLTGYRVILMKVDVRSERGLGLIGSILALVAGFLGAVPYIKVFAPILSLVALILILLALKGTGDKVGDERPFKYYLYGIAVAIAGVAVIFTLIILFTAVVSVSTVSTVSTVHYAVHSVHVEQTTTNTGNTPGSAAFGVLAIAVIVALIAVTAVLSAHFGKQAWEAMYEITGVKEFHETAKWLWWGALTLVIFVGSILLLIAAIYQIIAFYNLPEVLEVD